MLKLAKNLSLPDSCACWKMGIVGRTGSGKTNTAVVMAEQMIDAGVPVVIMDPQGDWWGLRSHYSIAILGGEHADVPLESAGGILAADFVINERVPVLLDLFTMGEGEMVRFATDFAKRLWQSNREALHVFLDEADLFAPQSGSKEKTRCLGAWQNVVRRGRSRGLGVTMLSQRPAVINKDLFTQGDPLIVHRLTASQDLDAIDRYLDFHGYDKSRRREITKQIASLKVGEAVVISPGELGIEPTLVQVPKRKSFDSSAAPTPGQSVAGPRSLADVDLGALKQAMADAIERQEANDPKLLQQRVRELERQLVGQAPVVDQESIDRAVADRDRHWSAELDKALRAVSMRDQRLSSIAELATLNGEASVEIKRPEPVQLPVKATARRPKPGSGSSRRRTQEGAHDVPTAAAGLTRKQQEVIDAIYWWESVGVTEPRNEQVGAVALVDTSGGYFSNVCGPLVTNGLIERSGGTIRMTDAGRAAARPIESVATLDDYHEVLRERVRKSRRANGKTVAILDAVLAAGGQSLTNEAIGEAVEIDTSGGYFSNSIGPLSTMGMIERRSGVVWPTDLLFPEGLA